MSIDATPEELAKAAFQPVTVKTHREEAAIQFLRA